MKVSSFRELMREQANAAVQISGAHHSSWTKNERLGPPIARDSKIGGTANWDNSISYNPRFVDEPLQEMFRNNRVHNQDRADLRGYRDAMRVVLHENVHLLSSEGREHSQAQAAFVRPGVRPLEEAVTELYSHERLNDYIDELGIDQVAPGIKDVKSGKVYQEFIPAAEGLTETIERRSGVEKDELIGRMAVVPADQKFRVAAEAMYDNSELSKRMPPDEREQAVGQIAQAMGPAFGKVAALPAEADESERRTLGAKAAGAGYKVMSQLKKEWRTPSAEQQVRRGVGTDQQRTAQPETGQGPQSPSGSPLPPDVAAAARVGLSGAQPLRTASRLAPDQQGARGSGASPAAVQRQGPETHTSR
jgi:hypothetical protein